MLQSLSDIKLKAATGMTFTAAEVMDLVTRIEQLTAVVEEMEEEHIQFVQSATVTAEELERLRTAQLDAEQRTMRLTRERNEVRNRLAEVASIVAGSATTRR